MFPEFPSAYQRWACTREGGSRRKQDSNEINEIAALAPRTDHLADNSSSDPMQEALERNLRTQWSPFEEEQLRSALAFISAVSRKIWLRVGLAIYYEWGPRGRPIWDDWSRTAPEKFDEADQERTWKSFAQPCRDRPITLRSIYHMASEAGWKGYQAPPLCPESDEEDAGKSQTEPGSDKNNNSQGTESARSEDAENIKAEAGSEQPNNKTASTLRWHGEEDISAKPKWLVKGLLPEIGCGLISGQWGTRKTFIALDLAHSTMRGIPFAGRRVKRRGGVLFIAAEGASEVAVRLAGLDEAKRSGVKDKLPFAWNESCPTLAGSNALGLLARLAKETADRMQKEFRLPLVLIIIDTLSAAAGFKDENAAAEAQQAMNVLNQLSRVTGALVLACDHFGKAADTGTRGSSAKEAAADVVIACLGEKNLAGQFNNPRISVRKLRGGATGLEIAYRLRQVSLSVDEDGEPVTTCVVEWDPEPVAPPSDRQGWPLTATIFRTALIAALEDSGIAIKAGSDGAVVRAVDLKYVRERFDARYPLEGGDRRKKLEQRRQVFRRSRTNPKIGGL